jgi:hypothetical protein
VSFATTFLHRFGVSLCYRVFASDCNSERAPLRSVLMLLRSVLNTAKHVLSLYCYLCVPDHGVLYWRCIVPLCPNAVTYLHRSLESFYYYIRASFYCVLVLLRKRTRTLCPYPTEHKPPVCSYEIPPFRSDLMVAKHMPRYAVSLYAATLHDLNQGYEACGRKNQLPRITSYRDGLRSLYSGVEGDHLIATRKVLLFESPQLQKNG